MIDWISVGDEEKPKVGQEVMLIAYIESLDIKIDTYRTAGFCEWVKFWAPYNPPVKKRWMPKDNAEYYFFIDERGTVFQQIYASTPIDYRRRDFIGIFSTQHEAEAMAQKIREFVEKEIGSV